MIAIEEINPVPLESTTTIRFQDCDPYSHLNNGRYLDYFMNAREDQVKEAYGFDIYDYSRQTGKGWVVSQNQIAYIRPALLMEEVKMVSQLVVTTPKFLHVEMRMLAMDGSLKSLLWAQFIHVDIRAGKSIPHDPELQKLFDAVCIPVAEKEFSVRLGVLTGKV